MLEEIPNPDQISPEEIRNLIHDLRVNRAELQFQNETLRQACEKYSQRAEEALNLLECSPD
ncbi:MAG: hypothetical protein ACYC9O_21315, partial [Candidatus Latescibacterota bacterium]